MNRKIEDAARALNAAMNGQAMTSPDEAAGLRPAAMFSPGTEISVHAVVIREVADDQVLLMFTDNGAIRFGCLPAAAHAEWVSS